MKEMKYSVIIPIYNAEKTLHRCVDSLLNQNYSNMELILVNDGSSDSSGAICEEYRDRYSCVVYIDKPNGGVSTARNTGLDVAVGDYVLFVDSDDYVSADYFQTMDNLTTNRQDDLVLFSHAVMDGKHLHYKIAEPFQSNCAKDCVPMFCRMLYTKAINQPWDKRYIRKIIEDNHIRFPENLYIGEDKCFNMQYVMHCRSCLISSELLYYVSVENDQSLSRKIRPDIYQQFEILNAYIRKTIQEADIPEYYRKQYDAAENLIQLRAVYSEAKRMCLTGKERRLRRSVIQSMCESLNQTKMLLPKSAFTTILKIPVRLKCVTLLDTIGKFLAQK